jgi:hypothetical protein
MNEQDKSSVHDEIFRKLSQPNEPMQFEDLILDAFEVYENDYQSKFTWFKNVHFNDYVHFNKTNLSHGIYFINCEFKDEVLFENITANQFDLFLSPNGQNITFFNCKFLNRLAFYGTETRIRKSLGFTNCTFEGAVTINDLQIQERLNIKNCTFQDYFGINEIKILKELHLEDNTFNDYVSFIDVTSDTLTFGSSNQFDGKVTLNSCNFNEGIHINESTFKDEVSFIFIETKGKGLTIQSATFEKSFDINYFYSQAQPYNGINKYNISNTKFLSGLNIIGTRELLGSYPMVDEIIIDFSSTLSGSILISKMNVSVILLKGHNTAAKLTLKDILVKAIHINDFINEGGLIFSNLAASSHEFESKPNSELNKYSGFHIGDSNLGKAQFFQVNFRSFNTIDFHNVMLTEISTSLVTWFTPKQLDHTQTKTAKLKVKDNQYGKIHSELREKLIAVFHSRKEIYRQLKFASQKQGDIPLSHEFQRREMEYYHLIVKHERPRQLSEFLILWSSFSNNFGQSWLRALWGLLVASFVSYIPIAIVISNKLDFTNIDFLGSPLVGNLLDAISDNFKLWFILLNPTHRISDLAENIGNVSTWLYFWDMLSRIVVAYFIFQTVTAFRKFSR